MTLDRLTFAAVSLFGLEGVTADECRRLGFENVRADTGKVFFEGDLRTLARANLRLRTAERVLILMGEADVTGFPELFDLTRGLPWELFLPREAAFPVTGHSLSSALRSVPDCQSIVKKAVVERLKSVYGGEWLPETGERYSIRFSLLKDHCALWLDTSGEGLHKRGYRANAGIAPLRETLAAGILLLSRYRGYESLYDPMCGSGTFLIEAAMIARNLAPGLSRSFDAEKWIVMPEALFPEERKAALSEARDLPCHIAGSDIDPDMARLSAENAAKAGVGRDISVRCLPMNEVRTVPDVMVTNPPYGMRMASKSEAAAAARGLARLKAGRLYVITSDERFEEFYGKRAAKKRKLYNGMIKCDLYMYFGSPSGGVLAKPRPVSHREN
ncbi:MAG: class I SAM-dependent RNA methyltransferase [Clostridia bacterium]|nr:class I SAM-dependent RNA methyltransferase [Clostridia bacterium]